jgi:hypothetical protein
MQLAGGKMDIAQILVLVFVSLVAYAVAYCNYPSFNVAVSFYKVANY